MDIATGTPEDHPTPLPLDASMSPGVQRPTQTAGLMTPADQTPAFDAAAVQAARLGGYEADCRGAQASGMAAENQRRDFYQHDMVPAGPAEYGITMTLPDVPANMVPPAMSDLHPWSGDKPVPAGADIPGYPA
jgi:hypothetical protein